jgi:hypothetical protein
LRELLPVISLPQAPEEGSLQVVNERLRAQGKVSAVG